MMCRVCVYVNVYVYAHVCRHVCGHVCQSYLLVLIPMFRRLVHLDSRKHHIGQKLAPSMSDADPSSGMAAIIEAVRSGKGGLKPGMIHCVALSMCWSTGIESCVYVLTVQSRSEGISPSSSVLSGVVLCCHLCAGAVFEVCTWLG